MADKKLTYLVEKPKVLCVQSWGPRGSRALMLWPEGDIISVENPRLLVVDMLINLIDVGFEWA